MVTDRAVVFDCDGVLVDSERLAATVLERLAAEQSIALPTDDSLTFIRGRRVEDWLAELEASATLPPTFLADWRAACETAFESDLEPIGGVGEVLARLPEPVACASSSPRTKIEHALACTGLLDHFRGRIHSAYEVGAWKPDPRVFLDAASTLEVDPARCAVIEDSVPGVRAGVAAGMTVLGYAGGAPAWHADALAHHGATPFDSMAQLPALLQRWRDHLPDPVLTSAAREQEMHGCP